MLQKKEMERGKESERKGCDVERVWVGQMDAKSKGAEAADATVKLSVPTYRAMMMSSRKEFHFRPSV